MPKFKWIVAAKSKEYGMGINVVLYLLTGTKMETLAALKSCYFLWMVKMPGKGFTATRLALIEGDPCQMNVPHRSGS